MMELKQSVTVSETVFAQEVDGEMVLLDMNSEKYFGLDDIGTAIWQAMEKSGSLDEIFVSLQEQYEVEPEILKKDLLDFVEKLQEKGIVQSR